MRKAKVNRISRRMKKELKKLLFIDKRRDVKLVKHQTIRRPGGNYRAGVRSVK